MSDLQTLAKVARCVSDDDWGTPRQIRAENAFFDFVKEQLDDEVWERLEGYCLKATTDEMIDEALRLVGGAS